jgi:bis(5'-nucleosidyl)-tetraphosphatase
MGWERTVPIIPLTDGDSHSSPTAAGVVVVRRTGGDVFYLLLRAFRNWDFPKGVIESGEAPLDTATREVNEEAGLSDLTFVWGQHCIDTAPYARGKIARYYIAESLTGEVELPISAALGRPEHHQFAWMPYGEAFTHLVPRLQKVLEWASLIVAEDKRIDE